MHKDEALFEQLLTVKDVARLLKVSVPTVYRLIKNDGFPPPDKVGHSSRWRGETIAKYLLRKRRDMPNDEPPNGRPRRKRVLRSRRDRK